MSLVKARKSSSLEKRCIMLHRERASVLVKRVVKGVTVSGAGVDGFKARTNSSRGFLPSFANLQISILTRSNPHVENVSVSGPLCVERVGSIGRIGRESIDASCML